MYATDEKQRKKKKITTNEQSKQFTFVASWSYSHFPLARIIDIVSCSLTDSGRGRFIADLIILIAIATKHKHLLPLTLRIQVIDSASLKCIQTLGPIKVHLSLFPYCIKQCTWVHSGP